MTWKILVYETKSGRSPLERTLNSLSDSTTSKVAHHIDLLELHGNKIGMPYSKVISRNLFELRIRGKEEVRIFYCFKKNTIYLLHIFKKKSQKTPTKELKMAIKRRDEIL